MLKIAVKGNIDIFASGQRPQLLKVCCTRDQKSIRNHKISHFHKVHDLCGSCKIRHCAYLRVYNDNAFESQIQESKNEAKDSIVADKLSGVNIYLTGMMGSGKTTVGRVLAERLQYMFVDLDELIEKGTECSISEIFTSEGEEILREIETSVLQEVHKYKNLIVSTGGGIVLKPVNWSYMHQGLVVWLKGPPEILAKRIIKDGIDKRPLINSERENFPESNDYEYTLEKVHKILESREPMFENADFIIPLEDGEAEDGASVDVVISRILDAIEKRIDETEEKRRNQRMIKIHGADKEDGSFSIN